VCVCVCTVTGHSAILFVRRETVRKTELESVCERERDIHTQRDRASEATLRRTLRNRIGVDFYYQKKTLFIYILQRVYRLYTIKDYFYCPRKIASPPICRGVTTSRTWSWFPDAFQAGPESDRLPAVRSAPTHIVFGRKSNEPYILFIPTLLQSIDTYILNIFILLL